MPRPPACRSASAVRRGRRPSRCRTAPSRSSRSRARIEAGIREPGDPSAADFVRSNYFDLGMILDYWGPRRLNHHTEATSMLYAARECARLILVEGRDAVIERHRLAGAAMLAGVEALGLEVFGDVAHKMNNVVAVEIPEGVPGDAARAALLDGLRHRDRHVLRAAARAGVAHRHDGLQRSRGRRAHDPRGARGRAAAVRRRGAGRRRRRSGGRGLRGADDALLDVDARPLAAAPGA